MKVAGLIGMVLVALGAAPFLIAGLGALARASLCAPGACPLADRALAALGLYPLALLLILLGLGLTRWSRTPRRRR
jgi:hypothetical protein